MRVRFSSTQNVRVCTEPRMENMAVSWFAEPQTAAHTFTATKTKQQKNRAACTSAERACFRGVQTLERTRWLRAVPRKA